MFTFLQYLGRFQGLKQDLTGLPAWARYVLVVAAVPGLVLVALSILALLVSILALLLITVPVKRLLVLVTGSRSPADIGPVEAMQEQQPPPTGRRHIDVTIIDDPSRR